MESFALYLLKSSLWLTGFALVYFLFLRNERFFMLKRYFLVAGMFISLIFPFIPIHYQVLIEIPEFSTIDELYVAAQLSDPVSKFGLKHVVMIVYLCGLFFLACRLTWRVKALLSKIRKSTVIKLDNSRLISTPEFPSPFSFFNYIFISPLVGPEEKQEIMKHELAHVSQMHWIDLLLIEFMRLLHWVNPVAWVYSSYIRQNHEYLADEVALQHTSDPAVYKAALLNQLFSSPVIMLTNSFSYSLNKKRFEMMKKTIDSPYRKMRVLFVLPVAAIILLACAEEKYDYVAQSSNPLAENHAQDTLSGIVKGVVYDSDGIAVPGAAIIITGTTSGSVTDSEGNFQLAGVPKGASLTVIAQGFNPALLKVDSNSKMTVKLSRDETLPPPPPPPSLKDIAPPPPPPPPPAQVSIKAASGMSTEHPLVYVDGVLIDYTDINKINPTDIASVSVLKGESALEQYGEEGKDGVILIVTGQP